MKAINRHGLLKAIAFMVIVFSIFSCSSCDEPIVPNPPVILTEAVAVIRPAENIKITSATIVAVITPNEDGAKAAFEIKETSNSAWEAHVLPLTFSGKDTVKVTFDFPELKAGTSYDFRIKVVSKAGEAVSEINSFETYAVSDWDGNLYHSVTIGNQVWLKENFKGTHYANGDAIANVTSQSEWDVLTTPAYCWYNNDKAIGDIYGGLYNWFVVSDPRGLIIGWHTPAISEFLTLADALGGYKNAGGAMKEAGLAHWLSPNTGATNSSGFMALPSGYRNEAFEDFGSDLALWSSTKHEILPTVYISHLVNSSPILYAGSGSSYYQRGFSIRLVRN